MHAPNAVCRLALAALGLAGPSAALSQSSPADEASVTLSATLNEFIELTVTPGTVNFDLNQPSPVAGDAAIQFSAAYSLSASRTLLSVRSYFVEGLSALTNGASVIPGANVQTSSTPGGTFTPCGIGGPAGIVPGHPNAAVCHAVSAPLSGNTSPITGSFFIRIDTGGLTLVNGTYTGTLFIQSLAS